MSDTIRISIGSEPSQRIACEVLKSSILRRTSRPVEFTESWSYGVGWHPLMETVPRLKGTKFSLWRWLVPEVYNFEGRAIYLDADQVMLGDIGGAWDSLPADRTIAAVCNAIGVFGKKIPELDHVQTSVMVIDCAALGNGFDLRSFIASVERGEYQYRDLMQAKFLHRAEVHELDPGWNHFGIVTPETKLVHWSHVASQPWRNKQHPTAYVWECELRETIEAGHLTMQTLKDECDKGHVDEIYYKRAVTQYGKDRR